MKRIEQKRTFFYKFKSFIVAILLGAFLSVVLHSSVHNSFDHHHDSSCGVYVLEQLYFSGDVVELLAIFTLFIPFAFILFRPTLECVKVEKQFAIRAPPLS